ncbi:9951_t:CDS:2, partial [Paraglomus brasilianum]
LTKSTTNAALRKVPNEPVELWETFLDDAFAASFKIDQQTRCFSSPIVQVTKVCPDVIRCSANNREELEQGISFWLVAVGEVKHELLIGNVNGATHCI